MIIAKKIKIFIIRDIKQFDENSKNIITRFISCIDVLYENKNILYFYETELMKYT